MMRKRVPPRKGPMEVLPEEGGPLQRGQQPHGAATAAAAWNGGDGSGSGSGICQRLLWFTCLGPSPTAQQKQQLRAALLSARRHAPSLVPVLVHSGPPGELTRFFEEQGGHAVQHELSFLATLKQQRDTNLRKGLLRHQVRHGMAWPGAAHAALCSAGGMCWNAARAAGFRRWRQRCLAHHTVLP
jgi:hypothetical protein